MKSLCSGFVAWFILLSVGLLAAQDVAKVSPGTTRILFENPHVRVVQSTFKPGAKEALHTHPADWYYVTKPGKLKISYTNGKISVWTPKVGESAWQDGEEAHTAENIGTTTLQYIMVEIKDAPTKTPN